MWCLFLNPQTEPRAPIKRKLKDTYAGHLVAHGLILPLRLSLFLFSILRGYLSHGQMVDPSRIRSGQSRLPICLLDDHRSVSADMRLVHLAIATLPYNHGVLAAERTAKFLFSQIKRSRIVAPEDRR